MMRDRKRKTEKLGIKENHRWSGIKKRERGVDVSKETNEMSYI